MAKIDDYLEEILKRDGSDLHFMAGDPPRIRQYGKLAPLRSERLGADFVREAIYEIMPMTDEIRRLTMTTADARAIRDLAVKGGMRTMIDDGRDKIARGLTTETELHRVLA